MANDNDIQANTEMSERESKARRTKVILISIIVLLVLAIAALAVVSYSFIFMDKNNGVQVVEPIEDISGSDVKDTEIPEAARIKTTTIPDLVSCFGLTITEASARLGVDFQLTKTEEVSDEENSDIKQLATFTYEPLTKTNNTDSASNSTFGTRVKAQILNIYASLDEGGRIIELYYVASMDLLGYPTSDFASLVGTVDTFDGILKSAGIKAADFTYQAPGADAYSTYIDPEAETKRIKKQSFMLSGKTESDAAPTAWSITITYDFNAESETTTTLQTESSRTIHLQLK